MMDESLFESIMGMLDTFRTIKKSPLISESSMCSLVNAYGLLQRALDENPDWRMQLMTEGRDDTCEEWIDYIVYTIQKPDRSLRPEEFTYAWKYRQNLELLWATKKMNPESCNEEWVKILKADLDCVNEMKASSPFAWMFWTMLLALDGYREDLEDAGICVDEFV